MTILQVEKVDEKHINVSYPKDHQKAEQIEKWLNHLSPGYVEYLLKFGEDPHCSACRDTECENVGHGDDACPGFKYGDDW